MTALFTSLVLLAGGPDYQPDNDRWNGLTYLRTTAEEANVTLDIVDTLAWETVESGEVLLWISPPEASAVAPFLAFVEDGGFLIVTVDQKTSPALLAAFGLQFADGPVIHDTYYRDHPAFPLLRPSGPAREATGLPQDASFLWFNVDELILNHPVALTLASDARASEARRVVVPFAEPGQAFAVEVEQGAGTALFVSDSSILINDMQRLVYGDKQFTANLLRRFCRAECAPTLVLPRSSVSGAYQPVVPPGLRGAQHLVERSVRTLNQALAAANAALSPARMYLLSVVVLAVLILWVGLLPAYRSTRRFVWESSRSARPSHVDYWVAALSGSRKSADFTSAAIGLEKRLVQAAECLYTADCRPGRGGFDDELAKRIIDATGAREATLRCLATFHTVHRQSEQRVRPTAALRLATFEQLRSDSAEIINRLPKDET